MKNNVSGLSNQELQVVQAFSSVNVPEEIFKACNMKDLIVGMISDQDTVKSNTRKLARLRTEKEDGNFISNWWNNRDDGIQDAQIDLSTSIGYLTDKSSQLLIVNTAISKLLNHQQQILLQQQNLLEQQTNELKNQNLQILDQQRALKQQQKEINAANQGLLEAKGLTQEQAQQLVGCVVRVTEAEKRVDFSNQELRNTVEQQHADLEQSLQSLYQSVLARTIAQDEVVQHLQEDISQRLKTQQQDILVHLAEAEKRIDLFSQELRVSVEQRHADLDQKLSIHIQTIQKKIIASDDAAQHLQESLAQQFETQHQDILAIVDKNAQGMRESVNAIEIKQNIFQEENAKALEVQHDSVKLDLQHFAVELKGQSDAMKNAGAQLLALQDALQKSEKTNRVALVAVACAALASLAWQIAQHFALL